MRQLFVPACVCLMTWSGPTGSDQGLSLDEFYGVSRVEKNVAATLSTEDATALRGEITPDAQDDAAPFDKGPSAIAAFETLPAPNAPIDIPMQDDAAQTLEPRPIPIPPVVKPVVHRSPREICDTLTKAAQSNDLPAPFFIRLLFQESRFKPAVVSSAGAEGIAQFMPQTSASMGLDNPFDPLQAIPASARLLRTLFQQFGNLGLAAAAYNAGPKRIQDWLSKNGKLPRETQGYVKIITGRPAETWKVAAAGAPALRIPRHAPCQEEAGLLAWNGPERIPVPVPSPFTHTPVAAVRVAMHGAASQAKAAKGAMQLAAAKRKHKHKPAHKQVAQR